MMRDAEDYLSGLSKDLEDGELSDTPERNMNTKFESVITPGIKSRAETGMHDFAIERAKTTPTLEVPEFGNDEKDPYSTGSEGNKFD